MGRRKREPMSEGKRNIITGLLQEYDIKTAKDIEDALKDLLGGTIQEMLEAEMDEHLGYSSYERSDNTVTATEIFKYRDCEYYWLCVHFVSLLLFSLQTICF